MNEGDKSVLKRYHQQLADDIIVDEELLGGLYTEGVFEKGMIGIVRSQSTPGKIQKLLELLPKRGPSALTKFIKVIETTYPWLATILISARETAEQQSKGSRNSHSSNKRLSSTTSAPEALLIDRDIKQIVAAFVHRQFGQSKRISEKDKKTVEHFLSDQIQGERNRYQRLLCSSSETPILSRSETPDDVFTSSEVTQKLFSMHTKLEPYVLRERYECDPDVECIGGDADGHPDYRSQQRRQCRPERQIPKLLPEDMEFDLIHKEIDIVLGQIESLSGRINDCLRYFESTDCFNYPLATLIGRVINKCRALEEESMQDRQQIKSLLNERDMQSDAISRLETERTEHRKQIQAAFLDMASLRQEKAEIRVKVKELEHTLSAFKQQQPPDRRGNLQYGLVSKSIKTTPRGGAGGGGGMSSVSTSMTGSVGQYSTGGGGGGGGGGAGGTNGQFVKTNQRPGNNYLNYARRGATSNRYGISVVRKKQMARSDTNLSSTAKF